MCLPISLYVTNTRRHSYPYCLKNLTTRPNTCCSDGKFSSALLQRYFLECVQVVLDIFPFKLQPSFLQALIKLLATLASIEGGFQSTRARGGPDEFTGRRGMTLSSFNPRARGGRDVG